MWIISLTQARWVKPAWEELLYIGVPDAKLHWTFLRFVRMWENNNFIFSLSPYELAIISLFPHLGSIASYVFVFVFLDCIRSQQKGNTECSPVSVQGAWLPCVIVHKGLAVLPPSNSWGVIFPLSLLLAVRVALNIMYHLPELLAVQFLLRAFPLWLLVFSHMTPKFPPSGSVGWLLLRPAFWAHKQCSQTGHCSEGPPLRITALQSPSSNPQYLSFWICALNEVGRTMEAAPGQRALTPTFLPPAASASPWVGFSAVCHRFFGSAGLVIPATLRSADQGGTGPLSPLPLCLVEHGCGCGQD